MATSTTRTSSTLASHTLRPRILGAAATLLLALAACSGDASPAESPTTVPSTSTTTTAADSPETTAPEPVPIALLADALAVYGQGYDFSTTVRVNDQNVSTQTGRWLDGASQITVESGDGQVEFIITADGQWTRLPESEWEELDGTPPTGYPLQGMGDPVAIGIAGMDAEQTTLEATYAAADLGLSGDPVDVLLTFSGATLTGFSFSTDLDGTTVESTATLSPITDTTPITAPTG